jgi:hypothetical protein
MSETVLRLRENAGVEKILCQRWISLDIRRNEDRILFRGQRARLARTKEEWPKQSQPSKTLRRKSSEKDALYIAVCSADAGG